MTVDQPLLDRLWDYDDPSASEERLRSVAIAAAPEDRAEPGIDSSTGYAILEADSLEAATAIAKTNPMITSVVLYELGRM